MFHYFFTLSEGIIKQEKKGTLVSQEALTLVEFASCFQYDLQTCFSVLGVAVLGLKQA